MSGSTSNLSQLVAATANRLRMVQADFADQGPEVRSEYLSEEIERASSSVVPEDRKSFLSQLMEQFPSWDSRVEVGLRKEETTERTATDAREIQDPNFLVARLIDRAAGLPEKERRILMERLREAGLATLTQSVWPEQALQAVRQEMRLEANQNVDAARALELIAMLSDFANRLDQLVWSSWRRIAPRSTIRRSEKLPQNVKDFLAGSQDVPRGQLATDLEKLRQLIASLISAIGQAGRQFAARHLARFSPVEIEALASMEGGGFLVSKEAKAWKKYVELADALNEASIENEIMEAIAAFAEGLVKGTAR